MVTMHTPLEKRRWTTEEDRVLYDHEAGEWPQLLADRTESAIRHRARALGPVPYKPQPRSPFAVAVKEYRDSHPGIPTPLEVLNTADQMMQALLGAASQGIGQTGSRVYLARTLQGLDRDTAARLAKVSATAWRSWENTLTEPTVSTLARVAAVLNVPVVWLLYGQRNDPWQP